MLESAFIILPITAAIVANSLTLWVNALRSILETSVCVIAWLAVWQARRVSEERYNFGFGKMESLVSLFSSGVMFFTLSVVLWNAYSRLQEPVVIKNTSLGIIALSIAVIGNCILFWRIRKVHRESPSPVLHSQGLMYRNAAIATILSLLSILISTLFKHDNWAQYLDTISAVVLCLFLFQSGLTLVRHSLSGLLDSAVEETVQMDITKIIVKHFDDYEQLIQVRTRRSGQKIYIELFLKFDPALLHENVLERTTRIKHSLEEHIKNSEVLIITS